METDSLKKINELYLGFSDAQNYAQRKNKQAFNDVFVKNVYLEELLNDNVFFLIGEKGTGKTAYATLLSNNFYKETKASTIFLSATDYEKFYTLKKNNNLDLTGFVGIWKVILLLIISKNITQDDKILSKFSKGNIDVLNAAIDEYYMNAFSPEITNVMKVIDESEIVAKLISKYAEVGGNTSNKVEFTETRMQHNLYYIEKNFSEAISKLKLNKDIVLFVDGIDIRPNEIQYSDYIECIRGLVDAAWTLNTSLLQNIRGSKGQLRIVLLLRPDIYSALNLQNATNKLLDNSVFLDWRTTYSDYHTSNLYCVAQQILRYKQEEIQEDIFDLYFPWNEKSHKIGRDSDTAFMEFLRISLSRPRDILVIMQYIQRKMKKDGLGDEKTFSREVFESDEFQNMYSEYFLSSLKDQLSFYYSNVDFEHFLKFFDFFPNSTFTYSEYMENYEKYIDYILENAKDIPQFVDDAQTLLQLLYDSNVITAIEKQPDGNKFFHFSYREKSSANISPKVWKGENISYRFHYGLYKKAKMGRY